MGGVVAVVDCGRVEEGPAIVWWGFGRHGLIVSLLCRCGCGLWVAVGGMVGGRCGHSTVHGGGSTCSA